MNVNDGNFYSFSNEDLLQLLNPFELSIILKFIGCFNFEKGLLSKENNLTFIIEAYLTFIIEAEDNVQQNELSPPHDVYNSYTIEHQLNNTIEMVEDASLQTLVLILLMRQVNVNTFLV